MNSLGRILLGKGWISEQQLSAALTRQRELGGRLGTCLLETGALGEQLLTAALAEQSNTGVATGTDLLDIAPEILALLPAATAVRVPTIPLRRDASSVHLAVTGLPTIALEDELSFVIGSRLEFHIANEARMAQALERHYGQPCPVRFATLLDRLDRAAEPRSETPADPPREKRQGAAVAEPARAPAGTAAAAHRCPGPRASKRLVPPSARVHETSVALTAAERQALQGDGGGGRPASSEHLLDVFARSLAAASGPDEVGRAVVAVMAELFVRVLVFRVVRDEVRGWMSSGPKIDRDWLDFFSGALFKPSVFRDIYASGDLFIGHLKKNEVHLQLAHCWGGGLENECVVLPVQVNRRLVCAVYGDRESLGVTGVDIGLLRTIGERTSEALTRQVLERKRRSPSRARR